MKRTPKSKKIPEELVKYFSEHKSEEETPATVPSENIILTNELLNNLMDRYKTAANEDLMDYKNNIESLKNIIQEYLNDFIVIGHNVLGQRVFFRYSKNPKEDDALSELFKKCFVKTMSDEGGIV